MTIASDLGFEVGGWYEVVYCGHLMSYNGVKIGDYVEFIKDDGDYCPRFKTANGYEFCASVEVHDNIPINVIPKKKPLTLDDLKVGAVITTESFDGDCQTYTYVVIGVCAIIDIITDEIFTLRSSKESLVDSLSFNNPIIKITYGDTVLYKRELLFKEDLKIKELEDTINKASKQIEELKKLKEIK